MTQLLDWAKPGTDVLVGLSDPLDRDKEAALVPGYVELDGRNRPVVVFTPPGNSVTEAAEANRLGDSWGSVHITDSGDGWAVWVFTEGSAGHLNWQIRETRRRIRRLLEGGSVDDPSASRELTGLASTLHQLACRAALVTDPAHTIPQAERQTAA